MNWVFIFKNFKKNKNYFFFDEAIEYKKKMRIKNAAVKIWEAFQNYKIRAKWGITINKVMNIVKKQEDNLHNPPINVDFEKTDLFTKKDDENNTLYKENILIGFFQILFIRKKFLKKKKLRSNNGKID